MDVRIDIGMILIGLSSSAGSMYSASCNNVLFLIWEVDLLPTKLFLRCATRVQYAISCQLEDSRIDTMLKCKIRFHMRTCTDRYKSFVHLIPSQAISKQTNLQVPSK